MKLLKLAGQFLVAPITLAAVSAPAQDKEKANPEPPPSPAHLTVLFEWIEIEHASLHEFVGVRRLPLAGPELRAEVAKLVKAGEATVIESLLAHAIDGERTDTGSVEEVVYPTEFDPPETNLTGEGVTSAAPAAFEIRNAGFWVEFEPVLLPGNHLVNLKLSVERVQFRGNRMWGQAESESPMPDFYTIKSVQDVQLRPGFSRLLATHRPAEPQDPKRKNARVLVFARADLHQAEKNEPKKPAEPEKSRDMAFVFESFETDQRRLNQLLFEDGLSTRGPRLREALLKDASSGKVTVVDTSVIAGRAGEQAQLLSIHEIIYPTEWDPPEISRNGARILPATPAAFETRNTGQTIKLEPASMGNDLFTLSTDPEVVTHIGTIEHGKKESKAEMPHFYTERITTKAPFLAGEDSLLGTFRPPAPADPDRKDPVRVWFVRGEFIEGDQIKDEPK